MYSPGIPKSGSGAVSSRTTDDAVEEEALKVHLKDPNGITRDHGALIQRSREARVREAMPE